MIGEKDSQKVSNNY